MVAPLSTGQLDVASGSVSAALFNVLAREDYPSLSSIGQLFVGTDVVSYRQARNVLTALDCRFVHTYGPTETSVTATFCKARSTWPTR